MTKKNKGAMDEAKSLAKEKAKRLAREAAGAVADSQELAKGFVKEATGAATGDEELKAKGRLERKKGTEGVKEDLDHIPRDSLRRVSDPLRPNEISWISEVVAALGRSSPFLAHFLQRSLPSKRGATIIGTLE